MNKIICENCRWWVAIKDSMYGECHRYPPSVFYREEVYEPQSFLFPKTDVDSFCGDFKEKNQ